MCSLSQDGGEPSKGTTVLMEKVEETDEINVTEAPPDQTDESESNITTGTGKKGFDFYYFAV